MSAAIHTTGYSVACGIVPEREFAIDRTFLSSPWARSRSYLLAREAAQAVSLASQREASLRDLDESQLDEHLMSLLPSLRVLKTGTEPLAEALGVAREVAMRCADRRPFDEQLFAAFILLRGGLAEMATGEGKTLTAFLAGAVAAVSGVPVHVFSSNDYLVSRDAEAMRPLYEGMGLRVGRVLGSEPDVEQRMAAYRCDVTYLTPRELAFDYLRDRRMLGGAGPLGRRVARIGARLDGGLRQRGLHFAIVDEADDVLLDQAQTPFTLTRASSDTDARARTHAALALAKNCVAEKDYAKSKAGSGPLLTTDGAMRVWAIGESTGLWRLSNDCLSAVQSALLAIHELKRDVDYVVRDDAIEIVDSPTGRRIPEQRFERGLHQLLEAKEGVGVSAASEGDRRIPGQALFRRYRRLSALTGTASEARGELWRVYGLPVVRVPLRRPSRRIAGALECHLDEASRDEAIYSKVEAVSGTGRPVLVGTRSVEESRRIADGLAARGVEAFVLNAADDAGEASIISRAGDAARVTVATNMAGRGTDIQLPLEVAQKGGLHIVCTRVGESRRIDRQLIGRCARQGDRGSFETVISLADPSFVERVPGPVLTRIRDWAVKKGILRPWVAQILRWSVQTAEEKRSESARRALLVLQSGRDQLLAFAGKSE